MSIMAWNGISNNENVKKKIENHMQCFFIDLSGSKQEIC